MSTVADIIDSARQVTLLSTSDVSDAVMIEFIDEGNNKVASAFDWPWLKASSDINSASGTGVVTLPADFGRLRAVLLDNDSTKLAELSDSEGWERWGDDLPDGTPQVFWFIDNTTIQLAPVETGQTATVVKYWKTPTVLDQTTDTPQFDSRFHKILADWAAYRVWQREEDYQKAQQHEIAFARTLNDMARFYLNRGLDYPIVFGESPDYVQRRRGVNNMPWLDGV